MWWGSSSRGDASARKAFSVPERFIKGFLFHPAMGEEYCILV